MADNKRIAVLVLLLSFLMSAVSTATEPVLSDYIGLSTCNLPQGAKAIYGMPVRSNKDYEVTNVRINNSEAILLVQIDKPQKKCDRSEITLSGTIRAAVLIDAKIAKSTNTILDCRWKDKHNDDHLVGVVRERPHKNPYVRPEQAWLVNPLAPSMQSVKPTLVECFDGKYD